MKTWAKLAILVVFSLTMTLASAGRAGAVAISLCHYFNNCPTGGGGGFVPVSSFAGSNWGWDEENGNYIPTVDVSPPDPLGNSDLIIDIFVDSGGSFSYLPGFTGTGIPVANSNLMSVSFSMTPEEYRTAANAAMRSTTGSTDILDLNGLRITLNLGVNNNVYFGVNVAEEEVGFLDPRDRSYLEVINSGPIDPPAPVPEPSTIILLGLGLVGLGLGRRFRKRRKAA